MSAFQVDAVARSLKADDTLVTRIVALHSPIAPIASIDHIPDMLIDPVSLVPMVQPVNFLHYGCIDIKDELPSAQPKGRAFAYLYRVLGGQLVGKLVDGQLGP